MLWKDNTFRPYVYFKLMCTHSLTHSLTHSHSYIIQIGCRRVDRRPNLQSVLLMQLTQSFLGVNASIKKAIYSPSAKCIIIKRCSGVIDHYWNLVLWLLWLRWALKASQKFSSCRWSVRPSVQTVWEGDNKCLCSPSEKRQAHAILLKRRRCERRESVLEVH